MTRAPFLVTVDDPEGGEWPLGIDGAVASRRARRAEARMENPESTGESFVNVSAETMRMLEVIARRLDCTVNAALEEAIREFDPKAARVQS